MRLILIAGAVALFSFTAHAESTDTATTVQANVVEHGGGCRKSSPTGQCCHKETKTGLVHCH